MVLTLVAAFVAISASSVFAYQATTSSSTTTTTTRDQDGIITSVNYQSTTPWITVRNPGGVEKKIYIDKNTSRGWTKAPKWDGQFVTGRTVRYQYEDRNNDWYARDVYIVD